MKIIHCEFPEDLLYDTDHCTWAKMEGDVLRFGITSILSWSFGTFSAVTLKDVGTVVARGQVVGSLDGSRHFDVVRSPVSGTVVRKNSLVVDEPVLLNKDPYGAGWLAELKADSTDELHSLERLPAAEPRLAAQIKERSVRCFAAFPDHEMFDIGVECAAVLVKLNELLANSGAGTVVHVVSDDKSSDIEMQRWSDQTGNQILESRNEGSFYHFMVRKK